jgi:phosphoribosylanthranilate isomerase
MLAIHLDLAREGGLRMPASVAPMTQTESRAGRHDADASRRGRCLKVCGITERPEIDALASASVDFVGLWHGVPDGPAELELGRWCELAGAALEGDVTPVLVTFSKDVERLRGPLETAGARWVQLHGYQTPGTVRAIKRIEHDVRVIKVLHVRGEECVEAALIGSYERAGVDVFLLDAVAADGRVGSTGETLGAGVALALAEQLERPFLLAGGISADNRGSYAELVAHPLFMGVDVDTNARGRDGKVDAARVAAISAAWKTAIGGEASDAR